MKHLLLTTIAAVVLVGCGPGYFTEFNEIKSKFLEMPIIDIVQMGGNKDVTYEDIWAEINVKGKGKITFYGISRESFKETPKIVLGKIGDYDIRWEGEGDIEVTNSETGNRESIRSKLTGNAINIGKNGEFAQFFNFEIKNIEDVITKYDQILSVVASWPTEAKKKYFRGQNGTDYNFYVSKELKAEVK